MKKLNKILIISTVLLAILFIQIVTSKHPFSTHNLRYIELQLVIVIGVPLVVWIEMKKSKQGKPMVDELSKMVALKAYAKSYLWSFISWGTVYIVSEYFKFNIRTFFLSGMAAMGVVGLLSWAYYKFKGVKDV